MAEGDRTVYVQPTTGGRIEISMSPHSSVNNLKIIVAKRLKVPKDKIVLLHKNKQLLEGSLLENNILEGSKLTLLPNIETGIMPQNPEQCVIQALQTLSESQVDNFLAGRSPLNLTMRIGDHMMFVQLQLGTTDSGGASGTATPTAPTPPQTPTNKSPPDAFPPQSPPLISSTITSLPSPPPSPRESSGVFDNPKVLTEASRNLTHTLRQLSSSALAKKMNESCNGRCCIARRNGGAVIESMFHHGKGVFSGTFSGTLSPFLQDKDGRPRRNICTIVHILNDLLGASSHCNPSSQCACSQTAARQKATPFQKDKGELFSPDENKALRQKVEQIQTLLREKRQRRREAQASPYSRKTDPPGSLGSETAVA